MEQIPHRLNNIDYYSRRIYHITMTTEGRRPLLGTVTGNPALPTDDPGAPCTQPSPLGSEVLSCLFSIEHFYPQARLLAWQLMPDHLHFVLFITDDTDSHLGQIIKGFKLGCNRAYRRLFPSPSVQEAAIPSQPPQPQQQPPRRPTTEERKHGQLWATSYYETPLSGKNQLERMIAYVHDNPRRLLLKRQRRDLFIPYPLHAAGIAFSAVGDAAILSQLQPSPPSPHRAAVQLSTHLYAADIDREVARFLTIARQGTLLISPFISPAEKAVMEALIAEGLSYVRLDGNGFGPYYKPSARDCDLVTAGRLLILTPWEPRPHLHRADFMALNAMAAQLAADEG